MFLLMSKSAYELSYIAYVISESARGMTITYKHTIYKYTYLSMLIHIY